MGLWKWKNFESPPNLVYPSIRSHERDALLRLGFRWIPVPSRVYPQLIESMAVNHKSIMFLEEMGFELEELL